MKRQLPSRSGLKETYQHSLSPEGWESGDGSRARGRTEQERGGLPFRLAQSRCKERITVSAVSWCLRAGGSSGGRRDLNAGVSVHDSIPPTLPSFLASCNPKDLQRALLDQSKGLSDPVFRFAQYPSTCLQEDCMVDVKAKCCPCSSFPASAILPLKLEVSCSHPFIYSIPF